MAALLDEPTSGTPNLKKLLQVSDLGDFSKTIQ